jgi:hypothetical protein
MKKFIVVLIFLAVVSPAFAQRISEENSSNVYYINVPVEKVYPSGQGYIIQYRRAVNQIGTVGIPNEWFTDAAGRAELITLPPGKNWPTMSVFYREGQFSHIRLYVHRWKAHPTWGNVPQAADLSRYFVDPDNVKIEL